MSRQSTLGVVAVALATAVLAFDQAAVRGAVLISTLGQSVDGGLTGGPSSRRYAVDFRTGSDAASVTDLTIRAAANLATYQLTGEIHANGIDNVPGTLVNTFDTSASVSANANYSLSDAGINLNPNTTYWLVVYPSSGGGGEPFASLSIADHSNQSADAGGIFTNVTTTSAVTSNDGGSTWNTQGNVEFIYSLGGTLVPEPASVLGLTACTLTCIAGRVGAPPSRLPLRDRVRDFQNRSGFQ